MSFYLWLTACQNQLSVSIRDLVKDMQTKVDQTLQVTQNLESTSSKAEQQLSHLPRLASLSNDIASAVTKLSNDASSAQQQLLATTNSSNVRLQSFLSQWEELAPTVSLSEPIQLQYSDVGSSSTNLATSLKGLHSC